MASNLLLPQSQLLCAVNALHPLKMPASMHTLFPAQPHPIPTSRASCLQVVFRVCVCEWPASTRWHCCRGWDWRAMHFHSHTGACPPTPSPFPPFCSRRCSSTLIITSHPHQRTGPLSTVVAATRTSRYGLPSSMPARCQYPSPVHWGSLSSPMSNVCAGAGHHWACPRAFRG